MVAEHGLTKMTRRLIALPFLVLTLVLPVFSAAANAQQKDPEKSFPNVVMVEGKLEGTTRFGAGIVVGARAGRLYVATANHVVRAGRSGEASDITVQFRFLPGEKFPARLLDSRSKDLDLAVLSVNTQSANIPLDQFNFNILGKSTELKRGSDVYPLGNPRSVNWGVSLKPEKVDKTRVAEIAFQSSYIQPGHSGGALLDDCGDIVGLIIKDSVPNGVAIRIESVLEALRQWNYPINMKATGSCTAPPAGQTAAAGRGAQQTGSGGGTTLDNNINSPVPLGYGRSALYRLSGPSMYGLFTFVPESQGLHTISAVSEPSRLDVAWTIFENAEDPESILECDTDALQRGIETCQVNLRRGRMYYLAVSNLTGDEVGEPAEALDFTVTVSAEPGGASFSDSQGETGSINIAYTPDQAGCSLNIAIQLEKNNRTITPAGNYFTVHSLLMGQENYSIYGNITCAVLGFSCIASGADTLYLEDGGTYNVVWQEAAPGMCGIGMFDLQ
jgi:hypothetical protein